MTTIGQPVSFGLHTGPARPLATIGQGGSIPVGVTRLSDLADVDTSTANLPNAPMVWRKGEDGIWRLSALPEAETLWGQQVRYEPRPPDDDTAPLGSVWVDTTTGTVYKAEGTS